MPRLNVNEHAELVMRDGTVLGRITAISVDFYDQAVGVKGVAVGEKKTEGTTPPSPPSDTDAKLFDEPDELHRLWAIYQDTVPGAKRRKLDSTRISCIRRALKARSFEECAHAIRELARSRWHNGDNPQKINYLDISYALGRKGDSADVIIDRWLERSGATGDITPVQAKLASVPTSVKHVVTGKMQKVRLMYRSPTHEPTVEAGRHAVEELRSFPGIEPIEVDGRFTGWRVVADGDGR